MDEPIRLNLGSGENPLPGYENIDLKNGDKAYPLSQYDDNCVDEVRASHLLEHFVNAGTDMVLKEWVRVLKPGGLLKIAVPDFEVISKKYQAGERGQYQGWIHGGQVDTNDVHFKLFDFDTLSDALRRAGLAGIHMWGLPGAQDPDSSCLEVSLNLAGYKKPAQWPSVHAAMSRPRLGWQDMFSCALETLMPMGINLYSRSGAYWGVSMANAIEAVMETGSEYVLTMDYDTVFCKDDVEDLLATMIANPHVDALVPLEMGRVDDRVLLNATAPHGQTGLTFNDMDSTLIPIRTGHFGLTLFRSSALKKLPRPWFQHSFNPNGGYKNYEDVEFWLAFQAAGLNTFLAPRVVIGHLEVFVMWADRDMKMTTQRTQAYHDTGKPRNVWR